MNRLLNYLRIYYESEFVHPQIPRQKHYSKFENNIKIGTY